MNVSRETLEVTCVASDILPNKPTGLKKCFT